MVYIITGEINCGKSTKLLSIYQYNKVGDGFYNHRISIYNQTGQELIHLTSGKTCLYSIRCNYTPDGWDELYTYKEYSFSGAGILFAKNIMNDMLENLQPAYIDEIGPLELEEKGFYNDFKQLLQTQKDIYVVVRYKCLFDVLMKFNIRKFTII